MAITRRRFLAGAAAAGAVARSQGMAEAAALQVPPATRFDPWIEVDSRALRRNVGVVAGLAAGRPILAVVKNNAYGLGLADVARILEPLEAVQGFAVVKADAALALRSAGITKPVTLHCLRHSFAKVRHVKPPASRSDSAEIYLVASGFKGGS